MKEIIKSIMLGFLVLTSLGLTFVLWYGTPAHEISRPLLSERIHFTSPRTLAEIILPERMIVHLGTGEHHVLFPGQDLYNSTMTVLNKHFGEQTIHAAEITADEWVTALEGKGVLLCYSFPVSFKIEEADLPERSIFASKVFLPAKGAISRFVFQSPDGLFFQTDRIRGVTFTSELYSQLFKNETATFFRRLEEEDISARRVFLAGDIYLPLGQIIMPALTGKTEEIDIERLKKVFFADISLVRRIEEKDGAAIYTDGRKGLRVYADGAIEYTTPVNMEALPLGEQALRLAGEVVALYGGWEENLQIWLPPGQEFPATAGQEIFFRSFFKGRPLVSREGCLSLVLTERGVQSFFRRLVSPCQPAGVLEGELGGQTEREVEGQQEREPEDQLEGEMEGTCSLEVIPADEALFRAIGYLLREVRGWRKIGVTDFYLAYYRRQPVGETSQLVPVWVLETDIVGMVLVDAHTGLFLDRLVFDER